MIQKRMLLSLGYRLSLPALDYKDSSRALAAMEGVRWETRRLVQILPSLHSYLIQRTVRMRITNSL